MATPFERSMRSLEVSDPRKLIVALITTILLLVLWLLWFFLARITIYQISQPIDITESEVIIAKFPLEASQVLKPGQVANLIIDGNIGVDLGPISGSVAQISREAEVGIVEVSIFMNWEQVPQLYSLSNLVDLTGKIQIEVEQVSPATMVIRAANSAVAASPDQTLPQDNGNGNGNGNNHTNQ